MPPQSIRKSLSDLARVRLGQAVPEANEPSDSEDDDDLLGMTVSDIKNGPSRQKIRTAYEARLLQAERRAHDAEENVVKALTVQNATLKLAVERKKRRRRTLQVKMIKDGGPHVRPQKRKGVLNARFKTNMYLIPEKAEETEAFAEAEELVELAEHHAQQCNNRLRVAKAKLGLVDELVTASSKRERPWVDRWGIPKTIKVKRVKVPSAQAKSE
ncbi:hypothetical protein EWM64_g337 [Hericium alpestre]|uniref:Uncharacterized protein n=1 Tax=Hericium alpestre TaxID=135208 RepID=A0A4Z0ABF2_9AGAM|nr:hypothetical protein EWM64_g337 [Hericium alpestre]